MPAPVAVAPALLCPVPYPLPTPCHPHHTQLRLALSLLYSTPPFPRDRLIPSPIAGPPCLYLLPRPPLPPAITTNINYNHSSDSSWTPYVPSSPPFQPHFPPLPAPLIRPCCAFGCRDAIGTRQPSPPGPWRGSCAASSAPSQASRPPAGCRCGLLGVVDLSLVQQDPSPLPNPPPPPTSTPSLDPLPPPPPCTALLPPFPFPR